MYNTNRTFENIITYNIEKLILLKVTRYKTLKTKNKGKNGVKLILLKVTRHRKIKNNKQG